MPSSARRTNNKDCPNALSRGTVTRTMWPPDPGTQRWLQRFGAALICVRHRRDPAGLRRMVTVELAMGPVAARLRQPRLSERSWYPITVDRRDRALRAQLREHGGYWDPNHGYWYLRGGMIRNLGLEDRITMDRRSGVQSIVRTRTDPEPQTILRNKAGKS
jgi:hypothetical protein